MSSFYSILPILIGDLSLTKNPKVCKRYSLLQNLVNWETQRAISRGLTQSFAGIKYIEEQKRIEIFMFALLFNYTNTYYSAESWTNCKWPSLLWGVPTLLLRSQFISWNTLYNHIYTCFLFANRKVLNSKKLFTAFNKCECNSLQANTVLSTEINMLKFEYLKYRNAFKVAESERQLICFQKRSLIVQKLLVSKIWICHYWNLTYVLGIIILNSKLLTLCNRENI